jgi:nicotinamidase-related amidase
VIIMKQALLVVDVQESFRSRPYFRDAELPAFLHNVQTLIDGCAARGIAIVQVFHREPGEDPANPFTMASGQVRTMAELSLRPAIVIYKEVHSALLGRSADGATLERWLHEQGIGELLITGIRTEQCCETTARHASDVGFKVRYITDATLTFPMHTLGGREVSAAEIRERTEMVLEGRFARVVQTAGAFA